MGVFMPVLTGKVNAPNRSSALRIASCEEHTRGDFFVRKCIHAARRFYLEQLLRCDLAGSKRGCRLCLQWVCDVCRGGMLELRDGNNSQKGM